jgi:hypothetical protein
MMYDQRDLEIKIENWTLTHNFFPEESKETGRRITLRGVTKETHFLNPREAYIEIWESSSNSEYKTNVNNDGENYIEYGQIMRRESDLENNINAFINAVIGVNMNLFNNLLFLIKELGTAEIMLILKLYGLDIDMISIEDDKWPDSKKLSITGVKFNAFQDKCSV